MNGRIAELFKRFSAAVLASQERARVPSFHPGPGKFSLRKALHVTLPVNGFAIVVRAGVGGQRYGLSADLTREFLRLQKRLHFHPANIKSSTALTVGKILMRTFIILQQENVCAVSHTTLGDVLMGIPDKSGAKGVL
jgi:hypothetical protein